jgi:hypothetical protein
VIFPSDDTLHFVMEDDVLVAMTHDSLDGLECDLLGRRIHATMASNRSPERLASVPLEILLTRGNAGDDPVLSLVFLLDLPHRSGS